MAENYKLDVDWFRGAINSMKATRWEFFKARWLGSYVGGEDDGAAVGGYLYRGKIYMTKFDKDRP